MIKDWHLIKHPYKSVITKRTTLYEIKSKLPAKFNCERLALVYSFIHHIYTTADEKQAISKAYSGWQTAFPWLSAKEIRSCLDTLVEVGMLEKTENPGHPNTYIPLFNEDGGSAHDGQGGLPMTGRGSAHDGQGHYKDILESSGLFSGGDTQASVTEDERLILNYLKENFSKFTHFTFNYEKHLAVIRKYAVEFPTVDMLAVLKELEAWEMDQRKDTKNWTLAIRNWMQSSQERGKRLKREQPGVGFDHENVFKGMPEDL